MSSCPPTFPGRTTFLPSAQRPGSSLEFSIGNSTTILNLRLLYQSLIRPHLEYACSIWDPHLKKDIEKLECVQKFGLKVCLKQWHSTYEDLTVRAGIPSLAVRRKLLKLCQLYSILNGHVNFHNFPTVSRPSLVVNRIRSVHSSSLSLPFALSNFHHNSFFPTAINLWNSLLRDVCTCHTVKSFKRAVVNYLVH